jgi:hypothetical protein
MVKGHQLALRKARAKRRREIRELLEGRVIECQTENPSCMGSGEWCFTCQRSYLYGGLINE